MTGYQRGAQRVDTLEFHIGTRSRIQTYDLPLRRRLLLFTELLGLVAEEVGVDPNTGTSRTNRFETVLEVLYNLLKYIVLCKRNIRYLPITHRKNSQSFF